MSDDRPPVGRSAPQEEALTVPAPSIARRGMMIVLSSPSGAGKSTLARKLLATDREEEGRLTLSVSVTTRARRGSEIDGVDYRFLTARQFEQMRDRGELLEWAQVHGNFYGTPKDTVDQALESGLDVLFDIDWQGARQIREAVPQDVVSIFVLPPSAAELRQRLERRAEDAPEDKPSPIPVSMALEGSGIAPGADVWFVGDTSIDMECAHNARCVPVLVRDPVPDDPALTAFPPSWLAPHCGQLTDWLRDNA